MFLITSKIIITKAITLIEEAMGIIPKIIITGLTVLLKISFTQTRMITIMEGTIRREFLILIKECWVRDKGNLALKPIIEKKTLPEKLTIQNLTSDRM